MPDDQELFAQIQKGNTHAFKLLFQKYYSGLVGFGTYLLHDQEESRELVQEIFLTLWEKRSQLQISSPKAYLFTAMNNKAMNTARHLKIVRSQASEHEFLNRDQSLTDPLPNPFLKDALAKAISELPEQARLCFVLTQFDGLSVKEAAKQLNLAEKTVANHLARSRKMLQKKLKKFRD